MAIEFAAVDLSDTSLLPEKVTFSKFEADSATHHSRLRPAFVPSYDRGLFFAGGERSRG